MEDELLNLRSRHPADKVMRSRFSKAGVLHNI